MSDTPKRVDNGQYNYTNQIFIQKDGYHQLQDTAKIEGKGKAASMLN